MAKQTQFRAAMFFPGSFFNTCLFFPQNAEPLALPEMHIQRSSLNRDIPLFKFFTPAVAVLPLDVFPQFGQLIFIQRLKELKPRAAIKDIPDIFYGRHRAYCLLVYLIAP